MREREGEREEGGWSGKGRERQLISEKNGHLQRERGEDLKCNEREEDAEEGERQSGKAEGVGEKQ